MGFHLHHHLFLFFIIDSLTFSLFKMCVREPLRSMRIQFSSATTKAKTKKFVADFG